MERPAPIWGPARVFSRAKRITWLKRHSVASAGNFLCIALNNSNLLCCFCEFNSTPIENELSKMQLMELNYQNSNVELSKN